MICKYRQERRNQLRPVNHIGKAIDLAIATLNPFLCLKDAPRRKIVHSSSHGKFLDP
jgi:hypothetical protein